MRVDFDTIQPEKTLTGAVKGVTVDQIRQLKDVAMTGAAAKQTVVDLKKKNAVLEEEKAELKKKIPSVHEKMEAAAQRSRLESQNRQLWSENEELKEALEEERSFSDRLLEGIDRVLDMLERHLPKQLLHLVDKARDLLPEHQTYRQEKQHDGAQDAPRSGIELVPQFVTLPRITSSSSARLASKSMELVSTIMASSAARRGAAARCVSL